MNSKRKIGRAAVLEIIGIALASALIIIAFCGRYFGGGFKNFANFFVGAFGMSFYGILVAVIVGCSFALSGKRILVPVKYAADFIGMYVVIILLVHMYTTTFISSMDYASYVSNCYNYYDAVPTFGGVVFGSVAYALQHVLTVWGASVLLFALLALTVFFAGDFFYSYATGKISLSNSRRAAEEVSAEDEIPSEVTRNAGRSEREIARENAMSILFRDRSETETPVSGTAADFTSTEPPVRYERAAQSNFDGGKLTPDILFSDPEQTEENVKRRGSSFFAEEQDSDDDFIVRGFYGNTETAAERENNAADSRQPFMQPVNAETTAETDPSRSGKTSSAEQTSDVFTQADELETDVTDIFVREDVETGISEEFDAHEEVRSAEENEDDFLTSEISEEQFAPSESENQEEEPVYTAVPTETPVNGGIQVGFDFVETEKLKEQQSKVHHYLKYEKPPVELLDDAVIAEDFEADDRKRSADAIVRKLAVFGIKTEALEPIVGPSVTRYLLRVLSDKTRMGDFKTYSDDLKSCLEAKDDIRIEAPVPGTNLVGIEVANKVKTPVVLRTILESDAFKNAKGKLVFAIGQEITGKTVVADLAEMPHLLVAGTTGSGKSVCLNCLIVSMMYKYSPEYLRFIMVDPKFVELSRYNGSPHLLTSEAITTVQDALAGMDYLISEMESRYVLFKQNAVGNITEYNQKINPKYTQKLPYLILVVDELADLMATSKKAFEAKIMRLAQKSRAAGIHIVLATQRPSVDIITGTIKANLPCRMALKVAAFPDSKTILDSGGAEKLLGKGDMLLMDAGSPAPVRVQGAYISNSEIRNLVEFCRNQNEVYYREDIADTIFVSRKAEEEPVDAPAETSKDNHVKELDPYCKKALRFWLEKNGGRASIASIQRSLNVGFNRAGKIFSSLQTLGYVEELPANEPGSKPLKVLVTSEQLDELFPNMEDY